MAPPLTTPWLLAKDKRTGAIIFAYTPTEKQALFHLAPQRNVLYGGRAGVGKSHCLRMDAYLRCLSTPNYRVLLVRRNFTELRDTHLDKAAIEIPQLTGDAKAWRASEYTGIFPNGSRLRFGHVDTDDALKLYLSSEFDCIDFDEWSTFTEYQTLFLSSRLRTTKAGAVPMLRGGSNPGAMWLYRYFIAKDVDTVENPAYNPDDFGFIPATIADNPHVNLREQELRLNMLPSEALRRMYRDGDWLAIEGQFFTDYRPTKPVPVNGDPTDLVMKAWHEIDELPEVDGKPLLTVPWIEYARAIDWGYDPDEGVCTWFALLPQGRVIAVKEYTFKRTIPKHAAQEIRKRSEGMKIRYTVGGPDMWMSDKNGGESIAETFAREKVSMRQADTDRVNGLVRIHALLTETTDDGRGPVPLLQVYKPGCPSLSRTFPMMQCDPRRIGDIQQKQDHWVDTVRYFAMSRPSGSRDKRTEAFARFDPEVQKALLGGKRLVLGTEAVRRHA